MLISGITPLIVVFYLKWNFENEQKKYFFTSISYVNFEEAAAIYINPFCIYD